MIIWRRVCLLHLSLWHTPTYKQLVLRPTLNNNIFNLPKSAIFLAGGKGGGGKKIGLNWVTNWWWTVGHIKRLEQWTGHCQLIVFSGRQRSLLNIVAPMGSGHWGRDESRLQSVSDIWSGIIFTIVDEKGKEMKNYQFNRFLSVGIPPHYNSTAGESGH